MAERDGETLSRCKCGHMSDDHDDTDAYGNRDGILGQCFVCNCDNFVRHGETLSDEQAVERALQFVAEFKGDTRGLLNCKYAEALAHEVTALRTALAEAKPAVGRLVAAEQTGKRHFEITLELRWPTPGIEWITGREYTIATRAVSGRQTSRPR